MFLSTLKFSIPIRYFSTNSTSFYDIVIVGGGLVGNAMACSIANSSVMKNQKVLLLESKRSKLLLPKSPPKSYSIRVSAVNPSSIKFFKKLGIWEKLYNYRTCLVTDLYVMDGCSQSNIHFSQLDSSSPIAHIIENDAIVSSLYDKLNERSNIEIKRDCRVEFCSLPESLAQNATINLCDGQVIETSLIIGADGVNSCVRSATNINCTSWNYEQSAIVCTLNVLSDEKSTIAWQRFTPLGPIALLPLDKNICSLVWTTSTNDAKRLMELSENEFIRELNYYLFTESNQNSLTNKTLFLMDKVLNCIPLTDNFSKLGLKIPTIANIHQGSTRASFPLNFVNSNDYVTSRIALIGDAAHRIHPLAGQGVNLGWFDVQSLTKCLENAVLEGGDLGSMTYLKDYEKESQCHNLPVMLAVDGLKKLYSNNFPPLIFLRSLGLHTLDKLLPIKDLIVQKASN